jgi:hypothetical protein
MQQHGSLALSLGDAALGGLRHQLTSELSLDRDENAAISLREVTPAERTALAPAMLDGAKPASLKQEATARRTRGETRRSTRQLVEVTA